jgi:hypothetical protein
MTVRDGRAGITLLSINDVGVSIYKVTPKQGRSPVLAETVVLDLPDGLTKLQFAGLAPNSGTGSWMLDNVCMAGRVDAPRDACWPFEQLPLRKLRQSPKKVFGYYYPIYTNTH